MAEGGVERPISEAEARVASYYLNEEYSDSGSSNRVELEHARSCISSVCLTPREIFNLDEEEYRKIFNVSVRKEDLKALMNRAISNHFKADKETEVDANILANCLQLFQKDYHCEIIENRGGELSCNYPVKIIVPMVRRPDEDSTPNPLDSLSWQPDVFRDDQFQEYKDLLDKASIARCRSRFPVPVILCDGKYICRSGTLTVRKTAAFEVFTQKEPESKNVPVATSSKLWQSFKTAATRSVTTMVNLYSALDMFINADMDEVKDLDVKVLELLSIESICDLMVENRKIHTSLSVGSSEKINLKKYGKFKILQIPYPGCEFFKRYSKAGRDGEGLVYGWNRVKPEINRSLGMQAETEENHQPVGIDWENYKNWDLLELTRNYMILLLTHATDDSTNGLLVHCISGWDRTPLFISLLRLSLWADGLIHEKLGVLEMVYLTIGYDWYLFGHDLPSRLKNREEIFHFCFNFLTELATVGYCTRKASENCRLERETLLCDVRDFVLEKYENKVKLGSRIRNLQGSTDSDSE